MASWSSGTGSPFFLQENRIEWLEARKKQSFRSGSFLRAGGVMLIEFRVGNFRSFDESQTFSLVASSDTRHPDNCIPFGKLRLLKSAAIYGANASGKSNLINAMRFMQQFVRNSATTMNVGDEIPVVSFQLNPESRDKASFFEATFAVDEVRYQYGFTATKKRVQDEWLIAYPKGRPQHLLQRQFNAATNDTTWVFRGDVRKAGVLLKQHTRDNGLVLSRGAELNIDPLTTVLLWFLERMLVLNVSAPPVSLINHTARRIRLDRQFRERVVRIMRHADLGISDLEVVEENAENILESFGPSVRPLWLERGRSPFFPEIISSAGTDSSVEAQVAYFTIRSIHRLSSGESVPLNFLEAESNGTQRFFALAGPWLDALDQGSLLVIDEFDCSMHPSLTQKLVELFQAREANPRGAQLVFSTHDSTLMDLELFRRDQIWIVEKDRTGASRLSSLYDFEEKPRNNEAVQQRYLAGRYGGVPVFGPTFEDLELK
jgi:AAA15 family ATPase/GTPase